MEKKTYIEPRLKVMLFDEDPILVDGTIPEGNPGEEGEDLSKENIFDDTTSPRQQSVWDED